MKTNHTLNGLAFAAAAATMFAFVPATNAGDTGSAAVGKCTNGNSCKGQSSCKTASNSCKGQNACKGQGFTEVSQPDCAKAGGTFAPAK